MESKEARDLIQEEIRLKMLGPGYAKDLILCSENANDEIIPGDPKKLYSTGVLTPTNESNEDDSLDGPSEEGSLYADIADGDDDTDGAYIIDDKDDAEVKKYSGEVEDSEPSNSLGPMNSHIGLITCVSNRTKLLRVSVNYGTYKRVGWSERGIVKVKVGKYAETIKTAIESFCVDQKLQESLAQNDISVSFAECLELKDGYLSISSKMTPKPTKPIKIPNKEYPIEASLVNLLFENHYQRTHHSKEISLKINDIAGKIDVDENAQLLWNSFDARGKKFLKILLQPIGEDSIFQPEMAVEVDGDGCIESYIEPITSMEEDLENNINEFAFKHIRFEMTNRNLIEMSSRQN